MSDWYQDVLDFHHKFRPYMIGTTPATPKHGTVQLRATLMQEELDETIEAMELRDLAGVADGLADLIYVAIGAAVSYGIDLRPVWAAVHAANMAKTGGGTRPDGKVLKPPGWQAPDVAGVLAEQMPLRLIPASEFLADQPEAATS